MTTLIAPIETASTYLSDCNSILSGFIAECYFKLSYDNNFIQPTHPIKLNIEYKNIIYMVEIDLENTISLESEDKEKNIDISYTKFISIFGEIIRGVRKFSVMVESNGVEGESNLILNIDMPDYDTNIEMCLNYVEQVFKLKSPSPHLIKAYKPIEKAISIVDIKPKLENDILKTTNTKNNNKIKRNVRTDIIIDVKTMKKYEDKFADVLVPNKPNKLVIKIDSDSNSDSNSESDSNSDSNSDSDSDSEVEGKSKINKINSEVDSDYELDIDTDTYTDSECDCSICSEESIISVETFAQKKQQLEELFKIIDGKRKQSSIKKLTTDVETQTDVSIGTFAQKKQQLEELFKTIEGKRKYAQKYIDEYSVIFKIQNAYIKKLEQENNDLKYVSECYQQNKINDLKKLVEGQHKKIITLEDKLESMNDDNSFSELVFAKSITNLNKALQIQYNKVYELEKIIEINKKKTLLEEPKIPVGIKRKLFRPALF